MAIAHKTGTFDDTVVIREVGRGTMKIAAVIRHVHFEDLGAFEAVLNQRGYAIRYHEAGIHDLQSPGLRQCELLIVLGGPIGAYEEDQYPFLLHEIRTVESRLAAGLPLLGICLGAQLIARALGASVYPGPGKEIGWAPLTLTPAGAAGVTRHLGGGPVLHWHGDTFDLPRGAERLASTPICSNQAFRYDGATLAFQFHPEASGVNFERWLIGHAVEIGAVPGLSVNALRAETQRWATEAAGRGQQCFSEWLDRVAPQRDA
jgi:GMP synthase (glutamine-hydrolysing)